MGIREGRDGGLYRLTLPQKAVDRKVSLVGGHDPMTLSEILTGPATRHYEGEMKIRNIFLALKDQLPLTRLLRNLWKGSLFGLFHERSHLNWDGKPKIMYNTKATAVKSAAKMAEKHGVYFSNYKCMRCDGFHIGKNQA